MRNTILALSTLIVMGCTSSPEATRDSDKPASYWVQALQSPDAQKCVRRRPTRSGKPRRAIHPRFPRSSKALDDDDAKVRDAAVLALAKMGRVAERAADALDRAQFRSGSSSAATRGPSRQACPRGEMTENSLPTSTFRHEHSLSHLELRSSADARP